MRGADGVRGLNENYVSLQIIACYNLDYLLILVIFIYMIYYMKFFLLFYIVKNIPCCRFYITY